MPAYNDAYDAVTFVKTFCSVRSSNRLDDTFSEKAKTPFTEADLVQKIKVMALRTANKYALNTTIGQPAQLGHTQVLAQNPGYTGGTPEFQRGVNLLDVASKAKALLAFPVGTCDNLAALAQAYLIEKKGTFPVRRMYFLGDADHVFLVIGTGVDVNKSWRTWDTDTAAICDPWADLAVNCNPTGLQTWMEKLTAICEPPFEPKEVFQEELRVDSLAAWPFRVIP